MARRKPPSTSELSRQLYTILSGFTKPPTTAKGGRALDPDFEMLSALCNPNELEQPPLLANRIWDICYGARMPSRDELVLLVYGLQFWHQRYAREKSLHIPTVNETSIQALIAIIEKDPGIKKEELIPIPEPSQDSEHSKNKADTTGISAITAYKAESAKRAAIYFHSVFKALFAQLPGITISDIVKRSLDVITKQPLIQEAELKKWCEQGRPDVVQFRRLVQILDALSSPEAPDKPCDIDFGARVNDLLKGYGTNRERLFRTSRQVVAYSQREGMDICGLLRGIRGASDINLRVGDACKLLSEESDEATRKYGKSLSGMEEGSIAVHPHNIGKLINFYNKIIALRENAATDEAAIIAGRDQDMVSPQNTGAKNKAFLPVGDDEMELIRWLAREATVSRRLL